MCILWLWNLSWIGKAQCVIVFFFLFNVHLEILMAFHAYLRMIDR